MARDRAGLRDREVTTRTTLASLRPCICDRRLRASSSRRPGPPGAGLMRWRLVMEVRGGREKGPKSCGAHAKNLRLKALPAALKR